MKDWFTVQLAMYAAYHRDRRNQATHHVGVPLIVFSLLILLAPVDVIILSAGSISLAMILIAVLLLSYLIAFPLIGMIALILYGSLLYLAHFIILSPTIPGLLLGIGLFVVGWIIQFIGHMFEGRKPALFDNIVQVFIAPAFLIAEALFLLGLEKGLKRQIEERMGEYLPQNNRH